MKKDSEQQREGEKRKALVEARYPHNAPREEYRKHKKLKSEELKKLGTQVMPKLRAESRTMKRELKELISRGQRLENANKQRRVFKEQIAKQEQMMRQIPTSWEFDGQKFNSFEHCQDFLLSQNYEQVGQGSDYSNITASHAGPSFAANPDLITLLDALNNHPFSYDLAAGIITGTLSNPGAASSGANHVLPVFGAADAPSHHDNIGLFAQNPASGTLNNAGGGTSSVANHDLPVFDAEDTGLFTYDPADGN